MKAKPKRQSQQVRIIGGHLKRRQVSFLDIDGLRPTPDRLRETLFNWLMSHLFDARVLDVCAGSGVLSFEAISRGASHITLIEPSRQALELQKNADTLSIPKDKYHIIHTTAEQALSTLKTPFDVIFLDPPYAMNLWQPLLSLIISHHLYHADTLIYAESPQPLTQVFSTPITLIKSTTVGQVHAGLFKIHS